ncbi:MAG: hypothetical protein ACREEM_39250 [Blastocatellia bacterium]
MGSTPAGRARFLSLFFLHFPAIQLNESVGLGALFLSSFLAATLLPGGSELVFAGVLASGAASV